MLTYHKQCGFQLLMTSSAERVTIKKSQQGSRVQTEVFEISTEVSTHFKRRSRIGQRCGDVIKRWRHVFGGVQFESLAGVEAVGADVAGERGRSVVQLHVLSQVRLVLDDRLADVTRVAVGARRVHLTLVIEDVLLAAEFLATARTRYVFLLTLVHQLDVLAQNGAVLVEFVAEVALVRVAHDTARQTMLGKVVEVVEATTAQVT